MSYPPFPWLKATLTSVALIGAGYALMKATVPTEEELYNRMAPDLQRKVDATRAARLAREHQMTQQLKAQNPNTRDPDAQKPAWADSLEKK